MELWRCWAVKDKLNSESFKSSLARVFQSVALALIISTTHPDAPLPLIWVWVGIWKQLISQSPNETEEIWSLRDTQLIGGLPLHFEMRDAESDEADEITCQLGTNDQRRLLG
jgi:hypothetical protein